jgi:hypothetical protein
MKLRMFIMASDCVSTAYFITYSDQSLCPYMYPHKVARQRLGNKLYRGSEYTCNSRIVGRVVSYARHVASEEVGY